MKEKFILTAPLTYSDWFLKDDFEVDADSIRYMLTRCKEFGISRVYWRMFDAGRTCYFSKYAEPMCWFNTDERNLYSEGWFEYPEGKIKERCDRMDFSRFDTFAAAVEIGHELGLEIYAWYSINEDDHGFGWTSRFTREHPECRWVRRNGRVYRSQLSFAYPEVQSYKTEIVREALSYDTDGILLDWIRTGDISDNPQTDTEGFADHGYETPLTETFTGRYGITPHDVLNNDPRWVDVRSEPITEYMRGIHAMLNSHDRKIPLIAMVQHPWSYRGLLPEHINADTPARYLKMNGNIYKGAKEGLFCDIQRWADEKLVDKLLVAGYYCRGGTPQKAISWLTEQIRGSTVAPIAYFWIPGSADALREDTAIAGSFGINELLLWEADYIDNPDIEARKQIAADIRAFLEKKL